MGQDLSMVVSRPRTSDHCHGGLTFGSAEHEETKSLRIPGLTLGSKLMLETNLREVVTNAVKSLYVVRRAGKLIDCPRVLKSCLNAYVLSSLEYCASVLMSSAESYLGLRGSIICSGERLCEGDLCYLGHRMKVSTLCFLHKIYYIADHPMHEYLQTFSAALCELALVILSSRTDQFGRLLLRIAVRLWNLLPSGVFRGGTLSFSNSAVNLFLQRV